MTSHTSHPAIVKNMHIIQNRLIKQKKNTKDKNQNIRNYENWKQNIIINTIGIEQNLVIEI